MPRKKKAARKTAKRKPTAKRKAAKKRTLYRPTTRPKWMPYVRLTTEEFSRVHALFESARNTDELLTMSDFIRDRVLGAPSPVSTPVSTRGQGVEGNNQ